MFVVFLFYEKRENIYFWWYIKWPIWGLSRQDYWILMFLPSLLHVDVHNKPIYFWTTDVSLLHNHIIMILQTVKFCILLKKKKIGKGWYGGGTYVDSVLEFRVFKDAKESFSEVLKSCISVWKVMLATESLWVMKESSYADEVRNKASKKYTIDVNALPCENLKALFLWNLDDYGFVLIALLVFLIGLPLFIPIE